MMEHRHFLTFPLSRRLPSCGILVALLALHGHAGASPTSPPEGVLGLEQRHLAFIGEQDEARLRRRSRCRQCD